MKLTVTCALFLATISMGVNAHAAQYPDNPDRFPSLGLHIGGAAESGDATFTDTGLFTKQDVTISTGRLLLDLRLPVSNSITLLGSLGFHGGTVEGKETALLLIAA